MTTRRASEREFQTAVIDFARRNGWLVCHFSDSRRQIRPGVFVGDRDAAGFPDLVLARGNHLIFAELKSESGRLSAAQRRWLTALEQAGQRVFVWRPDCWPQIEETLGARWKAAA